MKKNILSILCIVIIAMLMSSCASSPKTEAPKADAPKTETPKADAPKTEATKPAEQKVLRVGMEAAYAPFNWSQIDDKHGAVPIDGTKEYAGGYDVEISKLLAKELNMKLVIYKIEWDGLIPAINSGVIDVIIAGMSPTPERRKAVDFSDLYNVGDYVVVTRKDSKFASAQSINDFKGAKITAQLNTFHYDDLINQMDGVDKQQASADFSAMRTALNSKMIDGYISDSSEAISASKVYTNFQICKFETGKGFKIGPDVGSAVALKLGNPLLADINKALKTISKEQRDKLMEDAINNQPASN